MRTAGWVFMLIGLYFLLNTIYMGLIPFAFIALVFFLLGLFIGITTHGIMINIEDKEFKNYTNIFGFKQGKWKSLELYPFITLMQNRITTMAFSRSNRAATTSSDLYYDICLLNKTHQHKLIINRLKEKDVAVTAVKEMAKVLDKQLTKYNPTINTFDRKR